MESLKKIYPNVVVPQHGRGYFGIGIHCPKVSKNIGTLVPLLWETIIEFRELWIWILKNSGKK